MSPANSGRDFIRLVALLSMITSGAAALVSRAEIVARPYVQAVSGDSAGLGLTNEVGAYGDAAKALDHPVNERAAR